MHTPSCEFRQEELRNKPLVVYQKNAYNNLCLCAGPYAGIPLFRRISTAYWRVNSSTEAVHLANLLCSQFRHSTRLRARWLRSVQYCIVFSAIERIAPANAGVVGKGGRDIQRLHTDRELEQHI